MQRLGDVAFMAKLREFTEKYPPEPHDHRAELAGDHPCAVCHGLRVVRLDLQPGQPGFGEARPCPACSAAIRLQDRLHRFEESLPPHWKGFTFGSLAKHPLSDDDTKAAIALAKAWVKDGDWLYLHGPAGRGKSGLMVPVARELVGEGLGVRIIVETDWLDQLRRSNAPGAPQPDVTVTEAQTCDVLVVDDAGVSKYTEYATEQLLRVISARDLADRRTVFTSNFTLKQLAERWQDDRAASRIGGRALRIEMKGATLRQKLQGVAA